MSAKRWRLVVTELGGTTPVGEAVVDAPNWMAAFKSARGRIGEPETIPIGGSCTVSPDGRVNVLDPQRRRAYALIPLGDAPLHDVAPASPPQVAPTPAPAGEPPRRPRPKTMAYIPDAMVPPVAPPSASTPVSKKTMAYLPGQMGAPPVPPREIAIGSAQPLAPPVAAAPIPAAPAQVTFPAPAATSPAASTAVHAVTAAAPVVRIVDERHVPASAESPVHYHELSLETTAAQSPQALEASVREHVDLVRSKIGGDPAVQFVRVLAFATPRDASSEPLAVGVWKGWTGEISVQFPAAERSIAVSLHASPEQLYRAAADDPRLAELVEAFEDVWFLASPAAGLEFAARVLEEHFPDTLIVTAVRESASSLDFHVASTRGGSLVAEVPDRLANDGLVGIAAADPSRIVAVLDASRDPRARPSADGTGTGPLVAVAAAHGGAVLGVIRVSRAPGKAPFSAAEADLVRCTADRLAAFLRSRGTHLD